MKTKAYALPVVLILAGILAAAFLVFMTRLQAAQSTATMAVKRRQVFYVADAVARAATDIAGGMLSSMPAPGADVDTPAEFATFFGAQAALVQATFDTRRATLAPPGYTVDTLVFSGLQARQLDTLDSGPFRGMIAQIQPFTISVEVSQHGVNVTVATMRSSVQRGTLSMFQFWNFIDGYAYIYTGSGGKMAGRLHANGNVCMGGGGGGLYAETVTSAGSFYVNRSSGCRGEFNYHEAHTLPVIATRPLTGGIDEVNACNLGDTGNHTGASGASYLCTGLWAAGGVGGTNLTGQFDRDGANSSSGVGTDQPAATWRAQATARWNGQLQDQTHGVPVLKVPITGKPVVQQGRDSSFALQSNNQNSRFLVDPMVPSETADVRAQKLVFKADVRILNGVWYIRDPAAPERLGTPVWSDHPGTYRRKLGEDTMNETMSSLTVSTGSLRRDVGQGDIFAAGNRPNRYSYYRTAAGASATALSPTTAALTGTVSDPATRAVISYGVVHREVSSGRAYWTPGSLTWNTGDNGGRGGWRTERADTARKLLHGTRSGFRDGWMQVGTYCNDSNGQRDRLMDSTRVGASVRDIDGAQLSATTGVGCNNDTNDDNAKRSFMFNILPVNFDVGAFAAALTDTTAGELGSFFTSPRVFNGIVWIGSYWPGQYNGFSATAASSSAPLFWPFQGRQTDLLQPSAFGTDTNADGDTADANELDLATNADDAGTLSKLRLDFNTGGTAALRTLNHATMRRPPTMTSSATHTNFVDSQRNLAYQSALPYALCSDLADGGDADSTGRNERVVFDATAETANNSMNAAAFVVPSCERYLARDATVFEKDTILAGQGSFTTYGPTTSVMGLPAASTTTYDAALASRPNAVRVMNAHHLSRTVFPVGLTIATNLPAYLLGDTNSTSVPANKPADAVAMSAGADWRPFLIAADVVAVQSNAWEDKNAQWNAPIRAASNRPATETRYFAEVLAGWLESKTSNRDETFYFTRLLENWGTRRMRGSIVIGFASQYGMRFNWNGQSNGDGGAGEYAYDYQLDLPDNQPPGAPKFSVTATETFRRN